MRTNYKGCIGEISSLPGNSVVGVFHNVYVLKHLRGRGIGKQAHKQRLKQAKQLGYNMVICTADVENLIQLRILDQNGWLKAGQFISHKTGKEIGLFVKDIS